MLCSNEKLISTVSETVSQTMGIEKGDNTKSELKT